MGTTCYAENKNSFALDDWNAAGISSNSVFTPVGPMQGAPKKLVSFGWSFEFSGRKEDQTTPAQEYRAAIDSLYGHAMTKKEAAWFRREIASKFVPLKPSQTRLLPPRAK